MYLNGDNKVAIYALKCLLTTEVLSAMYKQFVFVTLTTEGCSYWMGLITSFSKTNQSNGAVLSASATSVSATPGAQSTAASPEPTSAADSPGPRTATSDTVSLPSLC